MWTEGYVSEVGYTFGYYPEMNPVRIRLTHTLSGFAPPAIRAGCELGYGQGLSINMHAAANPDVEWWGTDFNPAQASFARELAATGTTARLFDYSFEEFVSATDQPEFDLACLHGIWSWISDENRSRIAAFLKRKLAVGGAAYVSYNCLPGWAPLWPLRQLMCQHAAVVGAQSQGIVERIDGALAFIDRLFAVNAGYVRQNPALKQRFEGMQKANRHYLAHEYLNEDWHLCTFSELAATLGASKLSFTCSADLRELLPQVLFTEEQRALLAEVADEVLRVQVQDYLLNQQFRRDYFIRGRRRLSRTARDAALRSERFVALRAIEDVEYKAKMPVGEITLPEATYRPIIEFFSSDAPKSIAALTEALPHGKLKLSQVIEAVVLLCAMGVLSPTHRDDATIDVARPRCRGLNDHILQLARSSGDIQFLASPVTGGGIGVSRFHQLFLTARQSGRKSAKELATFVAHGLAEEGERILKDGKPVTTVDDAIAELGPQAARFIDRVLPVLGRLGIA